MYSYWLLNRLPVTIATNITVTLQHQVDAICEGTASDYQRNFDYVCFYPKLDGSKESLEALYLQSDRDVRAEALGRLKGGVRDCLLSMPINQCWESTTEELK